MSDHISTTNAEAPRRILPMLLAAGAVGLVLAGTIALWTHYGTAVFFETIRAGFVGCFG
jgi:hypothetical protein